MRRMKRAINIIVILIAVAACAALVPAKERAKGGAGQRAESYAGSSQAGISMKEARAIALRQVPGGRIKSGELERENGKLIYSFDIRAGRGIKEVQVDAITGKVVEVKNESAADEAKERRKEQQERKQKNAPPK